MIVKRYIRTLADTSKSNVPLRVAALCGQLVLPLAIAVALTLLGERVLARSNLIVGISIVTALMCAIAVLIFQMRISLLKDDKRLVDRDFDAVDQTFSLSVWVIVIGLVLTLLLAAPDLLAIIDEHSAGFSFCVYLLSAHFVCVIVVYIARFVRAYERIAEKR